MSMSRIKLAGAAIRAAIKALMLLCLVNFVILPHVYMLYSLTFHSSSSLSSLLLSLTNRETGNIGQNTATPGAQSTLSSASVNKDSEESNITTTSTTKKKKKKQKQTIIKKVTQYRELTEEEKHQIAKEFESTNVPSSIAQSQIRDEITNTVKRIQRTAMHRDGLQIKAQASLSNVSSIIDHLLQNKEEEVQEGEAQQQQQQPKLPTEEEHKYAEWIPEFTNLLRRTTFASLSDDQLVTIFDSAMDELRALTERGNTDTNNMDDFDTTAPKHEENAVQETGVNHDFLVLNNARNVFRVAGVFQDEIHSSTSSSQTTFQCNANDDDDDDDDDTDKLHVIQDTNDSYSETPIITTGHDTDTEDTDDDDGDVALESNLIHAIESIERIIHKRLEYADDNGTGNVPLLEDGVERIQNLLFTAVEQVKHAMDLEKKIEEEEVPVLVEEEAEEEESEKEEEEEEQTCVEIDDIEFMVDEGLDALYRRKNLRDFLAQLVQNVYEEEGEVEEVDFFGRERLVTPSSLPKEDEQSSQQRMVRSMIETPLLPQTAELIDDVTEKIGGYNDYIDMAIDKLAGDSNTNNDDDDDEGGVGSVGKTTINAVLDVLDKVHIPPELNDMMTKAGILLKNP